MIYSNLLYIQARTWHSLQSSPYTTFPQRKKKIQRRYNTRRCPLVQLTAPSEALHARCLILPHLPLAHNLSRHVILLPLLPFSSPSCSLFPSFSQVSHQNIQITPSCLTSPVAPTRRRLPVQQTCLATARSVGGCTVCFLVLFPRCCCILSYLMQHFKTSHHAIDCVWYDPQVCSGVGSTV